jgi:hypothetical protein
VVHDDLSSQGFTVIAVALDAAGADAARAFAEAPDASDVPPPLRKLMGWDDALWEAATRPSYPSLLDTDHRVARLFNITNVPSAVWIDEAGRVVRPPENAGAYDMLRDIDLATFEIPDQVAANGRAARAEYLDAVRDWVAKGADSQFALSPAEVNRRSNGPSAQESLATAHFQIGAWHTSRNNLDAAKPFFEEAVRLRPDSWTFRRQKIASADKEAIGELAASPEFWEAVNGLGERSYYEPFKA